MFDKGPNGRYAWVYSGNQTWNQVKLARGFYLYCATARGELLVMMQRSLRFCFCVRLVVLYVSLAHSYYTALLRCVVIRTADFLLTRLLASHAVVRLPSISKRAFTWVYSYSSHE